MAEFLGAASSFGTPAFTPFGDSEPGSIANRFFNSSLTGAGLGTAYAGMTGGDIGQGAARGALGWAAGEGANMLIGHSVGLIASGGKKPVYVNGSFIYDANTSGWITFSNVITGPTSDIHRTLSNTANPAIQDPFGRSYFQHEQGHTHPQATLLGPGYIPAHAASLAVGGFLGGTHKFGLLERFWHPVLYPVH